MRTSSLDTVFPHRQRLAPCVAVSITQQLFATTSLSIPSKIIQILRMQIGIIKILLSDKEKSSDNPVEALQHVLSEVELHL